MKRLKAKNKIWSKVLSGVMLGALMTQTSFAAPSTVMVMMNGTPLATDQPAVIRNSRTMVPFNALFSALGATVSWNEPEQKVTGVKGDLSIELFIGKNNAVVNGQQVTMDTSVQIINSRTMVPLSFVSKSMGASVSWDGVNYIASVSTDVPPIIDDLFDPQNPGTVVTPPIVAGNVPPKDAAVKSNVLAGTFAAENLSNQRFVIQFNSAMTSDIRSLTSGKEGKGTYTVSGNTVTLTSELLSGSFTLEELKYNNKDIFLLKDVAGGKATVAMTPISYEDFAKLYQGQK